jgi:hypothetical protein
MSDATGRGTKRRRPLLSEEENALVAACYFDFGLNP